MFQRKKKQIQLLTKQYEKAIEQYVEYKQKYKQIDEKYKFLRSLVSDDFFHKLIDIYIVDELEYVTYITNFMYNRENGFECRFISQRFLPLYNNKLASADIEVKDERLEIVNLDACPSRNGHGSRMLQYIEDYARSLGVKKIFGLVWNNTPIGLENLIRFYEKNGYEIIQKRTNNWIFRKTLCATG